MRRKSSSAAADPISSIGIPTAVHEKTRRDREIVQVHGVGISVSAAVQRSFITTDIRDPLMSVFYKMFSSQYARSVFIMPDIVDSVVIGINAYNTGHGFF